MSRTSLVEFDNNDIQQLRATEAQRRQQVAEIENRRKIQKAIANQLRSTMIANPKKFKGSIARVGEYGNLDFNGKMTKALALKRQNLSHMGAGTNQADYIEMDNQKRALEGASGLREAATGNSNFKRLERNAADASDITATANVNLPNPALPSNPNPVTPPTSLVPPKKPIGVLQSDENPAPDNLSELRRILGQGIAPITPQTTTSSLTPTIPIAPATPVSTSRSKSSSSGHQQSDSKKVASSISTGGGNFSAVDSINSIKKVDPVIRDEVQASIRDLRDMGQVFDAGNMFASQAGVKNTNHFARMAEQRAVDLTAYNKALTDAGTIDTIAPGQTSGSFTSASASKDSGATRSEGTQISVNNSSTTRMPSTSGGGGGDWMKDYVVKFSAAGKSGEQYHGRLVATGGTSANPLLMPEKAIVPEYLPAKGSSSNEIKLRVMKALTPHGGSRLTKGWKLVNSDKSGYLFENEETGGFFRYNSSMNNYEFDKLNMSQINDILHLNLEAAKQTQKYK